MNFVNGLDYVWLICACAAATYLTRLPAILLGRQIRVTPRLKRGLDSIPIGVFAAMVVPTLVNQSVSGHHVNLPFVGAAVVSIVIALWTRNPLWTMLAGVASIVLLRLIA